MIPKKKKIATPDLVARLREILNRQPGWKEARKLIESAADALDAQKEEDLMAIGRPSGRSVRRCEEILCAPEDIAEINHVWKYRRGEYANCLNLLRAHRLTRQGFLSRVQHSEHVRGERRFFWWRFEVTEKGKGVVGR